MKLFKLNNVNKPSDTIDEFASLAWVERYQSSGDFQLVVENDIRVLDTLPLGVLISHTDTYEVMIVENHEIVRDEKKNLKITISGRSFETFAEERPTLGSVLPVYESLDPDVKNVEITSNTEPSNIAKLLLQTRLQQTFASSADQILGLAISTDLRNVEATVSYVIKRGDIYSPVLEMLRLSDLGIKMVRPNGAQTTLNLVIHDGADLINIVVFYAQRNDLEDARYFRSIKGYKNYALIAAHTYSREYESPELFEEADGLDRRMIYVEADDIEGSFPSPSDVDVVGIRAQSVLDQHRKTSLLQATIAKTAKPKFKVDYDVGDLVTVFGEFGVTETMRVSEHILTVDKKGMQGYPSLIIY